MGSAVNYRSINQKPNAPLETLYIDHKKESWRERFKNFVNIQKQVVHARMQLVLDKKKRTNLYVQSVRQQLRRAGISGLDLLTPETFSIAKYLYPNENILAAICGKSEDNMGSALIAITDKRLIYLNQIPLFASLDELSYDSVSGVSAQMGKWDAIVTLHTGTGDYKMHSVNTNAAKNFIYVIDERCMRNK